MSFRFNCLFILTAFMIGIKPVAADQLEVCIQMEPLNTATTQLQQNQIPSEQVAAFLGQQVAPHIAPVAMQAINTGNTQQKFNFKLITTAVLSTIVGGGGIVVVGGVGIIIAASRGELPEIAVLTAIGITVIIVVILASVAVRTYRYSR